MEEFKKWDREKYPLPPTTERGPVGRDALKQRECAWKAALKWAKAMHDVSSEPRFSLNITKELND